MAAWKTIFIFTFEFAFTFNRNGCKYTQRAKNVDEMFEKRENLVIDTKWKWPFVLSYFEDIFHLNLIQKRTPENIKMEKKGMEKNIRLDGTDKACHGGN